MGESEGQEALLTRLRSAEGHLRAVIGMAERGAPCEDVLNQLNAVCAALRAAGQALVRCQLQTSARIIVEEPCAQARLAEVRYVARLYGLWAGLSLLQEQEPTKHDTTHKR